MAADERAAGADPAPRTDALDPEARAKQAKDARNRRWTKWAGTAVAVVTELVEGDVYHWGPLMAGALLGSLPVAIIYSFFVEYYVSGLTGAVKE